MEGIHPSDRKSVEGFFCTSGTQSTNKFVKTIAHQELRDVGIAYAFLVKPLLTFLTLKHLFIPEKKKYKKCIFTKKNCLHLRFFREIKFWKCAVSKMALLLYLQALKLSNCLKFKNQSFYNCEYTNF